ncbi:MAG: aspartyl/glutamyl-tRNA(Asn/Gln) amidotransferase C subunit [Planctomycetota bacterium]|jgi:aspartyl/glutamyl-tRNA(Asn/Gln) amidotransferase C subunit
MPKPPPIDQALVEHLGELARISLPKERQTELRDKLQQLVDAFSSLGEADFEVSETDSGPRTVTPSELREDRAETPPDVTEVLANSPQTAADCFVVARVVEP